MKFKVYFDSVEGQKLLNYYQIKTYPFIGIIDPRTGEKVMQFNSSKIDPLIFCEKVTNFLCDYDSPLKEDESPSKYLPPNYIRNSTVKKESSNEIVQVDDDQDDVIVVNGNSKLTNGHNDEKVSDLFLD